MERNKRLAKTTLIYFIGTFGSKILIFFLMPYYSHFLTAEQYGSINLIINLDNTEIANYSFEKYLPKGFEFIYNF